MRTTVIVASEKSTNANATAIGTFLCASALWAMSRKTAILAIRHKKKERCFSEIIFAGGSNPHPAQAR
jgi:hypothetical protein